LLKKEKLEIQYSDPRFLVLWVIVI